MLIYSLFGSASCTVNAQLHKAVDGMSNVAVCPCPCAVHMLRGLCGEVDSASMPEVEIDRQQSGEDARARDHRVLGRREDHEKRPFWTWTNDRPWCTRRGTRLLVAGDSEGTQTLQISGAQYKLISVADGHAYLVSHTLQYNACALCPCLGASGTRTECQTQSDSEGLHIP